MSVQHVRLEAGDLIHEAQPHQKIRRMRLAVDRDAPNAELQSGRDLGQRRVGALAAGQAIGDDADMVARIDLPVGEIENMTKNSANWRTDRVDNAKGPICSFGHCQNQRSPTRTVSPGLMDVPSGTTVRLALCVSVTLSRLARGENPPAIATALSTLMFGT